MRTRRVVVFALLCTVAIAGYAGPGTSETAPTSEATPAENQTDWYRLLTVQDYGWFGNHNGDVFVVDRAGNRVWEYQPENASVFDAEHLDNGNVMVSYGQAVPKAQCPERFQGTPNDNCVKNHVREIDPDTNEVAWEYTWWDRFISYHEVHDADRLPSGETVIIDMGKDRTFTVDQDGEVTWEWSAVEHLDNGTEFWDTHVAGTSRADHEYTGPNQDWTHMNDVDKLQNGNFLMSIRNFDVVITVDPETDRIARVFGEPGNHTIIHEQHDPHYLPEHDTIVVADSENDRIVEYDFETHERVWTYQGPSSGDRLAWPRDADRLPSGHTLIADSRNFRALEVDASGEVVWQHSLEDRRGIIYDVDRVTTNGSFVEEPTNVTSGESLDSTDYSGGFVATVESWIAFVLPPETTIWGLLSILLGIVALGGLGWEAVRAHRN